MGGSNTASGAARGSASRVTFECWATDEHARPLDWYALQDDPPGRLPRSTMTSRSWSLQAGLHFSQRAQHVVHSEQAARCCAMLSRLRG